MNRNFFGIPLYFLNHTLNFANDTWINSFIAIIGVAGVVVNNSLMLIDFINKAYRSGLSRRLAINEGIRVKLRPIILTTVTLTLLPMAIGILQSIPSSGSHGLDFCYCRPQQCLLKIGFEPNKSGRFGQNWTFMCCRIYINIWFIWIMNLKIRKNSLTCPKK